MAATTFPRFLELPRELQIQVWEEAIKDTIEPHRLNHPNFGVQWCFTYAATTVWARRLIMSRGREIILETPYFSKIMGVCLFSRLVACEWWKDIWKGCAVDPDPVEDEEGWKASNSEDLEDMIEDLRNRLEGGSSIQTAI